MADVGDWFRGLPQFTRYWFGGTVAVSLLARFGLIPPSYLVLTYELFVNQFQIWRPITALFYYPISPQTGFHFLINLYFLINYSKLLENGEYMSAPADYATMLLLNWAGCIIAALFMNMSVLMDPMVLSVLYVWCQLNKDVIVSFWFGTQFKAMWLPWVLWGFNMVVSGGGVAELIGIIVGHFYFYIKYQYPQQYGGQSLLSTPAFLESWFPPRRGMQAGFGVPPTQNPAAPQPPRGGSHSWGRGNSLGGS